MISLLVTVIVPTLTAEIYYAAPIQQYILGDRYEPYQGEEDNEVLTPGESSGPRYITAFAGNDGSEKDNERNVNYYSGDPLNPVSYAEQGQTGGGELLQTDEARNDYYRPYVRYRQLLRRRARVPTRRYDTYPGYALSGYISNRDRFPTVA